MVDLKIDSYPEEDEEIKILRKNKLEELKLIEEKEKNQLKNEKENKEKQIEINKKLRECDKNKVTTDSAGNIIVIKNKINEKFTSDFFQPSTTIKTKAITNINAGEKPKEIYINTLPKKRK